MEHATGLYMDDMLRAGINIGSLCIRVLEYDKQNTGK